MHRWKVTRVSYPFSICWRVGVTWHGLGQDRRHYPDIYGKHRPTNARLTVTHSSRDWIQSLTRVTSHETRQYFTASSTQVLPYHLSVLRAQRRACEMRTPHAHHCEQQTVTQQSKIQPPLGCLLSAITALRRNSTPKC